MNPVTRSIQMHFALNKHNLAEQNKQNWDYPPICG